MMNKNDNHHEKANDLINDLNNQAEHDKINDHQISESHNEIVKALDNQIMKLKSEISNLNDKVLRYRAEAENSMRRARIDIANAHKYGIEKLARELLEVVDSLERGLEIKKEDTECGQLNHIIKGMELTNKLLLDILYKFNIKQINPIGDVFDPKKHEALTLQITEDIQQNSILNVVQKGFEIHDRILRPARVIVAKSPSEKV